MSVSPQNKPKGPIANGIWGFLEWNPNALGFFLLNRGTKLYRHQNKKEKKRKEKKPLLVCMS